MVKYRTYIISDQNRANTPSTKVVRMKKVYNSKNYHSVSSLLLINSSATWKYKDQHILGVNWIKKLKTNKPALNVQKTSQCYLLRAGMKRSITCQKSIIVVIPQIMWIGLDECVLCRRVWVPHWVFTGSIWAI